MRQVLAFAEVNLKLLLKDKLSFIWSIALPTILLLSNKSAISGYEDLRFWWVYIVVSSYLFGVGIYALQLKESGVMRVIFSIRNNPWTFFFGNFVTQIIYSIICLAVFNLIASVLLDMNYIKAAACSLKTILYCIPIGFLGYNLTLLRSIHVRSVETVASISIFGLLILMNIDTPFNRINPLAVISDILIEENAAFLAVYLLVSLILILCSLYSVSSYTCVSNERR